MAQVSEGRVGSGDPPQIEINSWSFAFGFGLEVVWKEAMSA